MNHFEQILAGMTKAERDAHATRGDVTQLSANLVRLNQQLKQRIAAFEQRMAALEQRLEQEAHS